MALVHRMHFEAQTRPEDAAALFQHSIDFVQIETFSYCNRRCSYCPNAFIDRLSHKSHLDPALFARILADLRSIGYSKSVILSNYNEPLSDRIILDHIRQVREALPQCKILLFSNGDYLNPAYLDDLAEAGLSHLVISLHPQPGAHFDQLVALDRIAQLCLRTGIAAKFESFDPRNVSVVFPHPKVNVAIIHRDYEHYGVDRAGLVGSLRLPEPRTKPCLIPFGYFYVDYLGNVTACCHIRSDAPEHKDYVLANVADHASIFDIYAGPLMASWRRHLITDEVKKPPCDGCADIWSDDIYAQARARWADISKSLP